jgi:gliding motility-associated-like protein
LYTTTYLLAVTTPGGCKASGEITVDIYTPLSIPNAFTPNGDGRNDVLYVLGGPEGSRIKDFTIFDRWGQAVFRSEGGMPGDAGTGWDGRYRGMPAPAGVYVYEVVMGYANGKQQVYKGTVILVR